MAKKIESLTKAQEAAMPLYVEKWIKVGLSTDRADRPYIEAQVAEAYKVAKKEPPKEFFWFDSPASGMLGVTAYFYAKEKGIALKDLTEKDMEEVAKMDVADFCCFGSHEAGWMAFYDFFRTEVGLTAETEDIQPLINVNKGCGWWWCYEGVAFMSEKPTEYHYDMANRRLDNPNGPAIAYADGYNLWYIGGVEVNEKIVMTPEKLTLKEIKSESNMEVKRIMMDRYGIGKYLDGVKAKVVDADMVKVDHYDPDSPAMPRCLMRTPDNLQYLCGTDGSTKRVYYMNVSPDVKTCVEAHKSINGGIDESSIVANS